MSNVSLNQPFISSTLLFTCENLPTSGKLSFNKNDCFHIGRSGGKVDDSNDVCLINIDDTKGIDLFKIEEIEEIKPPISTGGKRRNKSRKQKSKSKSRKTKKMRKSRK